ncbi:MAG: sulfatase-like hydrolase/transferase [Planctomycetota bacterium]
MSGDGPEHVLVFFCDQLQAGLLSAYGGEAVRTPHLDALAREGAVFEQAYTPTAICSPARASLMTGVYPHCHHMFNNSTPSYSYCHHLRPDQPMIQDWAAETGACETAYFGKWHIGPAEDLFGSRFDHTMAADADRYPFGRSSHWHPNPSLGRLTTPLCAGTAGLLDVDLEAFPDVVAARYSADFLRRRDRTRPFLLFCAFPGPHSPWMLPEAWGLRHDPETIALPANRNDRFEDKPVAQRKLRLRAAVPDGHGHHAEDDRVLREGLACMYAYIELIDEQVGRVVEALKEEGLYEKTWIVFTADHGDMAGAHGFLSKGSYMYDEIYRIPLIIRPPGGAGGRRLTREPVTLMDLTATCLHVLGGEPSAEMLGRPLHGASLAPLLRDSAPWPRTVHYAEYHGDWYGHYSSRMVTDGRWKLVWSPSDRNELYDLATDPAELRNRFDDPVCAGERARLFTSLREEAERLGDGQVRLLNPDAEAQPGLCGFGPLDLER